MYIIDKKKKKYSIKAITNGRVKQNLHQSLQQNSLHNDLKSKPNM